MTPGIQPQSVNIKTIKIDPQPLSITAKGGNKIERSTRQIPIDTKLQIIHLMGRKFASLLRFFRIQNK